MLAVWKVKEKVKIHAEDSGLFVFRFKETEEQNCILHGGFLGSTITQSMFILAGYDGVSDPRVAFRICWRFGSLSRVSDLPCARRRSLLDLGIFWARSFELIRRRCGVGRFPRRPESCTMCGGCFCSGEPSLNFSSEVTVDLDMKMEKVRGLCWGCGLFSPDPTGYDGLLESAATSQVVPEAVIEYIGAEFNNVKFSDVPINPNVEFHFLLSFAIDYDTSGSSPTNGNFNVFWDTDNLGASQVSAIKNAHSNVKVGLSLGGDSVNSGSAYFNPSSVDSWVSNAVSSLTSIIQQYNLDGIDIDYEHFRSDPNTFSDCIGRLIKTLKDNGVSSLLPLLLLMTTTFRATTWPCGRTTAS
ncbi:hypothetical protein ACLB2K_064525 [Fragaria x ananassa]